MAKVQLHNGKPLMIGHKVALDPHCCCGGTASCPIPFGSCHAVCFQVNIDQQEVNAGGQSGNFIEFFSSSKNIVCGVFADYGSKVWTGYIQDLNTNNFAEQNVPFGGTITAVWVTVQFNVQTFNNQIQGQVIVNGIASPFWTGYSGTINQHAPFDAFRAGADLGGPSNHHSIRIIGVSTFIGSGENAYNFVPGDSFDSFTTGASIVNNTLRVDSGAAANTYAQKNLSPNYHLFCCDPCLVNQINITGSTGSMVSLPLQANCPNVSDPTICPCKPDNGNNLTFTGSATGTSGSCVGSLDVHQDIVSQCPCTTQAGPLSCIYTVSVSIECNNAIPYKYALLMKWAFTIFCGFVQEQHTAVHTTAYSFTKPSGNYAFNVTNNNGQDIYTIAFTITP